jgi:hypothetical protein
MDENCIPADKKNQANVAGQWYDWMQVQAAWFGLLF